MKFIALRSTDRSRVHQTDESPSPTSTLSPPSQWDRDAIQLRLRGVDQAHKLRRYINPNLVIPLHGAWIPGSQPPPDLLDADEESGHGSGRSGEGV